MGNIIPIHFMGPITVSTVEALRNMMLNALRSEDVEAIQILISSEGGELSSGFVAYNYIRSIPIRTIAVNMGSIESSAIIAFLARDERMAVKHSRFMLHNLSWNFDHAQVHINQMEEYMEGLRFDADRYASIYQERTTMAIDPIDVRRHLTGPPAIIGTSAAFRAGITTTDDVSLPHIPASAGLWDRLSS